jgi:hypothetical protein
MSEGNFTIPANESKREARITHRHRRDGDGASPEPAHTVDGNARNPHTVAGHTTLGRNRGNRTNRG